MAESKARRDPGADLAAHGLRATKQRGRPQALAPGAKPPHRDRYEANAEPHYHAQCRVCGSLIDVPAKANGYIRGRTPLPEGFEIEEIRVTLLPLSPLSRRLLTGLTLTPNLGPFRM